MDWAAGGGESEFDVHMCGGDVARKNARHWQRLHADRFGETKPTAAELDDYEWLVASVAVHDVDEQNAPLCFVGKQCMLNHMNNSPPASLQELDNAPCNPFICMKKGDIFVRHPLVWHCGTPNRAGKIRLLPGVQYKLRRD
jgi:ectoine hydroxylase-related dioxygenase (phytanoyl-CoA dioxygenase family)